MKIIDSYNLENLVEDYGFKKSIGFNVYSYDIYYNYKEGIDCSILVNTVDYNDRKIYFFYFDELHNNKDIVDYAVEIPDVLMKMIKDGVVKC